MREGKFRWSLWPKILLVLLVCWTVFEVFYISPTEKSQSKVDKELYTDRWTIWTKQAKQVQEDPIWRLVKEIMTAQKPDTTSTRPEIWKRALMSRASINDVQKISVLVDALRARKFAAVSCHLDSTLDPIPYNRIYIASNLHDSEEVLPNFVKQIMEFILDNPDIEFYVSIYESGSKDKTPYILMMLEDVLEVMNIPHNIVYNGTVTRHRGQQRINFLAEVRNEAIMDLIDQAERGIHWDKIVFINDVFFCKQDVHRLLLHNGDINCGMDFTLWLPPNDPEKDKYDYDEKRYMKREYYNLRLSNFPEVKKALDIPPSALRWSQSPATRFSTKPEDKQKRKIVFYDIWVAHDSNGRHFENPTPFVKDGSYEHERLKNGLPFPAECCWNGVAILNPEPFVKYNLFFRSAAEDECNTSECVLLCHDFQRLGYSKVVVDPGVRTTYNIRDAQMVYDLGIPGSRWARWKIVKKAKPMKDIQVKPGQLIDCCPLQPDFELVNFHMCSHDYNIWNKTSAYTRLGIPMVDTQE